MSIHKLIKGIMAFISQEGYASEHQWIPLGAIGFVSFIIYYFIWGNVAPTEYVNIPLRIVGGTLCLLLILKDYWPRSFRPILPYFWFLTLLYCFPFFFCFMLFKNPDSNVWILTTMTGLFFLILLVSWRMIIPIVIIGVSSAWYGYILTTTEIIYPERFVETLPTYLTLLIASGILIFRDDQVQKEKLNSLITLSGIIAHELRTPLRTIDSSIDGIAQVMPRLTQTYQIAKEHDLDIPFIAPQQFTTVNQLTENVKSETYAAFTFIDMLLHKTKANSEGEQQNHSIKLCIENAIARYPFSKEEKTEVVIRLTGDDFIFHGNDYFMLHIFFNLLKNALYYILKAQKGEITIHMVKGADYNTVYFKDTGTGIPKRDVPHVFERFFTRTHRGTGLGLAFSKMVMESIGGKINCESVLGVYTEFTLSFPIIKTSGDGLAKTDAELLLPNDRRLH